MGLTSKHQVQIIKSCSKFSSSTWAHIKNIIFFSDHAPSLFLPSLCTGEACQRASCNLRGDSDLGVGWTGYTNSSACSWLPPSDASLSSLFRFLAFSGKLQPLSPLCMFNHRSSFFVDSSWPHVFVSCLVSSFFLFSIRCQFVLASLLFDLTRYSVGQWGTANTVRPSSLCLSSAVQASPPASPAPKICC